MHWASRGTLRWVVANYLTHTNSYKHTHTHKHTHTQTHTHTHTHTQHFVCGKCEKPFLGTRHYEKRGVAYCETHYHQVASHELLTHTFHSN